MLPRALKMSLYAVPVVALHESIATGAVMVAGPVRCTKPSAQAAVT